MDALQALISSGSSIFLLLGFFLPPFIDVINRFIKDSQLRWWVSQAFCVLLAGALVWLSNAWVNMLPIQIVEMIGIAFFAIARMANLTYEKLWEKSELRENLSLDAKKVN